MAPGSLGAALPINAFWVQVFVIIQNSETVSLMSIAPKSPESLKQSFLFSLSTLINSEAISFWWNNQNQDNKTQPLKLQLVNEYILLPDLLLIDFWIYLTRHSPESKYPLKPNKTLCLYCCFELLFCPFCLQRSAIQR